MSIEQPQKNIQTKEETGNRLPSDATFRHACKFAIADDKPILMDYWSASINKTALIGVKDSGERMLVKSEDEYTSPVKNFFKIGSDYIVVTENSIYLVSTDIPIRKISGVKE